MLRLILNPLLCLLVTLGLVVAGAAQASAGVSMALAETQRHVVICGEGGAHEVVLDADGKLVKGQTGHSCRDCPDCTLMQSASGPAHPEVLRPVLVASALVRFPAVKPAVSPTRLLPAARAPPSQHLSSRCFIAF